MASKKDTGSHILLVDINRLMIPIVGSPRSGEGALTFQGLSRGVYSAPGVHSVYKGDCALQGSTTGSADAGVHRGSADAGVHHGVHRGSAATGVHTSYRVHGVHRGGQQPQGSGVLLGLPGGKGPARCPNVAPPLPVSLIHPRHLCPMWSASDCHCWSVCPRHVCPQPVHSREYSLLHFTFLSSLLSHLFPCTLR
eukprot:TRINITY_DN6951_c0_g1_i2.p1 TRINITY_DN6951_c0_g1~~TRINITY_DN6951_c0_g1_i2.p1  ORF type:complete len:195 (+),score=19.03 TRINITY_DN6951_c0_g1_i2:179-763(+)